MFFQEYFFAAVYYESLMNTISAPLNMPPRYAEFSKGRVLVGFNTSSQNVDTPWLRDDRKDVAIASDYWDNPAASDELGKELKDTFHEVCDSQKWRVSTFQVRKALVDRIERIEQGNLGNCGKPRVSLHYPACWDCNSALVMSIMCVVALPFCSPHRSVAPS